MSAEAQKDSFLRTIAALRRKQARGDDASDDDDDGPVLTTNRGNKLKRRAKHVQQGRLDNPKGSETYKEKITHAGYERYIVSRNPPPYLDEYGEEIEEDSEFEDLEKPITRENPYEDIKIEELLAPLTSAAQLDSHPSMGPPYRSKDLPEMVDNACKMLQREQEKLWLLKKLMTTLRGDATWIPVGAMHTDYDEWLLQDVPQVGQPRAPCDTAMEDAEPNGHPNGLEVVKIPPLPRQQPPAESTAEQPQSNTETIPQPDATNDEQAVADEDTTKVDGQENGSSETIAGSDATMKDVEVPDAEAQVNGAVVDDQAAENNPPAQQNGSPTTQPANPLDTLPFPFAPAASTTTNQNGTSLPPTSAPLDPDDAASASNDADSSAPSHRMTTRRRAAASPRTSPGTSSPPSPTTSIPPPIHPHYLPPASANPFSTRDLALPPADASYAREYLLSLLGKQEEIVRSTSGLLSGLQKALRMRKEVRSWCRHEGHVGEMSDGEDWVDVEEWGLVEGQLGKGREEDEEEEDGGGHGHAGGGVGRERGERGTRGRGEEPRRRGRKRGAAS
ncbi:hypothetical protein K402DRAFT_466393 [Aulographum hederae CBS 113979]|uniref:Transcriptional regulatory protein RXT2 N-terminal domain-containing protein n=1 Tax=Aulographum hederae CBS 113979 TaxID=1176131 RepID=A0A6G1GPS1_9PEZI|nr:hypothetical protein K402DRAFT_466393 [Aulographum hederae CBS 113979]